MKKYAAKTGFYALDFIAALLVGILAEAFVPYIFQLMFEMNDLTLRILRAILNIAAVSAMLFVSAMKVGYKSEDVKIQLIVIPFAIILAVQLILTPVFDYAGYITGGAYDVAVAAYLGNQSVYSNSEIPVYVFELCVAATHMIYIPMVLFGERYGAKKRQKDRDELISKK